MRISDWSSDVCSADLACRLEQQQGDVFLPLFEPTGGPDAPDRVPEPKLPTPRAPLSDDRFEHRSVLSGIGRAGLGRRLMVAPLSLTVAACLAAVARRSEERRVGKACVSTCYSRGSRQHKKKK